MSTNGKRDNFTATDLSEVGESISIPKPLEIVRQVVDTVKRWSEFAHRAGVMESHIAEIVRHHRLNL
jgi:serine/threonine-protein kinase HipA